MPTWDEYGYRRARRVYINRKQKHRDRWKPKGAGWLHPHPVKHYGEPDYEFNRRCAPAETGFGVAYEKNPDARKY